MRVKKKVEGIKKGTSSTNPDRLKTKGSDRTRATINRLNMMKHGGKKIRDKRGKVVREAEYQDKLKSGTVARVEPNRKWFGNTRVIGQDALQKFQKELGKAVKDPFKVVLRTSKLPLTLLDEKPVAGKEKIHILDTESFRETFSKNRRRKRPNIALDTIDQVFDKADEDTEKYIPDKDIDLIRESDGTGALQKNPLLNAGQSKRIWGELYRVLDSSDVIIQVLDARDPMGTRCRHIEYYLQKEKPHKHLIFLLNKVDLQPIAVTRKWVQILQKERPTLAFHASITKPFGKGALIGLLRQFSILHKDKKSISVGFIGYPNVGKSSVINTMKRKKVCNVAPIPGETKVWQFVAMTKRVFLIDCPGVVYSGQKNDETELILRGVCRVENIEEPSMHIGEVLRRAEHEHLARLYQITGWEEDESGRSFLEQLGRARGKLMKGGEPDVESVAKTVLRDWQYGKIPYLTQPDETYVNKEAEEKSKKIESDADIKAREEHTTKRLEIEMKLKINQDYDKLKPKNLDDVEDYGKTEDDSDEEAESGEESEEEETEEKEPVSEMDIVQAKLAKIRKAVKGGMLQRKEAVNRHAARREKMESTVDLTLVAKESQKEEADEKEKERKMAVKLDQLEGIATPMETDTAEDENKKTEKKGTSKSRRSKKRGERVDGEVKGTNYYSGANVKNKSDRKKGLTGLKKKLHAAKERKGKEGAKTRQRK